MTGLTSRDSFVSDGEIYAWPSPGPIRAADIAHVALAETGGARLGFESSPLVESDGEDEHIQGPEKIQSFPYLQLVPPHCRTCRC